MVLNFQEATGKGHAVFVLFLESRQTTELLVFCVGNHEKGCHTALGNLLPGALLLVVRQLTWHSGERHGEGLPKSA